MSVDYEPGDLADARVRRDGKRHTLVFVRDFAHPPDDVWVALTDPASLSAWAPYDADRDLGSTGSAKLTMVGVPRPEVLDSVVRIADPPRLLEYTWADGIVRWELEETEAGTRLTLLHTLDDPDWVPKTAAGWHMCLDIAERALDGEPIGRIAVRDVRKFGWERLNAGYAEKFGIENTGWPEEMTEEER